MEAAGFIGIPPALIAALSPGPLGSQTQAINDAWTVVAVQTVAALLCVPFAKGNAKAVSGAH